MPLDGKEMTRLVREYCEANGLDPGAVSVTFNRAGEITGHVDVATLPGWTQECCCGEKGCGGGLAERLAADGYDPAELSTYQGTISLGSEERMS